MNRAVLNKKAFHRIQDIHCLSRQYNGKHKEKHEKKILELMRKHIGEIRQLHKRKNKHYLIETGDLIVLCFELLLENKISIDQMMLRCFKRYETKLTQLLQES